MTKARLVVLVDDDPMVTAMYRMGLERATYRVATCTSSEELWALLATERPDLIVLDWAMPGRGGREIVEALLGDPRTKDLPIVILSAAWDRDREAEWAANAGVIAWLDKGHMLPADLPKKIAQLFPD